ncbi:MAG TPA: TIR domain-containing protein [Solidesulfovibrio sp.]|nr:TIR domain-containing protein [Solidesulfovibrio sp.]
MQWREGALGEAMPDQPDFKYFAFISYSHRDKRWGDWLHKALETYKVPKRLHGHAPGGQALPKRLFPVFRDREELPTSASLGAQITDALARSRFLIVICSPHAARSVWVNEEIKTFKAMGRENRILSLIVDGEPNAADKPEGDAAECFPPALRFRLDAAGNPGQERSEPIAADARPGKDGRKYALLKLAAGLLGVSFDDLKQREQERRVRRLMAAGAVMAVLMTLFAGLAWRAWVSERKAVASEQAAKKSEQEAKERLASNYLGLAKLAGDERRWNDAAIYYQKSMSLADRPGAIFGAAFALENASQETTIQNTAHFYQNSFYTNKDGTLQLSFINQGDFTVYNTRSKTSKKFHIPEADEYTAGVNGIAFSHDGCYVAAAMDDRSVLVWKLEEDASPVARLEGHDTRVAGNMETEFGVLSVAFSPNSQLLASGGYEGIVCLWNMRHLDKPVQLRVGSDAKRLAFSNNGKLLFVATPGTRTVQAWDIQTRKKVREFQYNGTISSLAISKDDSLLAIGCEDGTIYSTELRLYESTTIATYKNIAILELAFSGNGKYIFAGCSDGTIREYDIDNKKLIRALTGPLLGVNSLTVTENPSETIYGSSHNILCTWQKLDSSLQTKQKGISVINSEKYLDFHLPRFTKRDDAGGNIFLINISNGDRIASLGDVRFYKSVGYGLLANDTLSRLVTITSEHLAIYNMSTGVQLNKFDCPEGYPIFAFSPDQKIFAWSSGRDVNILDMETGQFLEKFIDGKEDVTSIAIATSNDLVYALRGNDIWIYSLKNRTRDINRGHRGAHSIYLSQDGRYLLTVSDDDVWLWDTTSSLLLVKVPIYQHGNEISDIVKLLSFGNNNFQEILNKLTVFSDIGLSYDLDINNQPVSKNTTLLAQARLEAAKAGRIWWREDGGRSLVPLYENELQQAQAAAAAAPAN